MLSFIFSPVGRWIAAALGFVAAIAGIFFAGKREGRAKAEADAKSKDLERAKKIEGKADAARRNPSPGDPDKRLRDHGRLRD